MPPESLHQRLLDEARQYSTREHIRELLTPYRDVILIYRAKFMSYEQIAATLTAKGVKVTAAAIGQYCRRTYSRPEILRERVRQQQRGAGLVDEGGAPT